ncbi:MAG: L,D-transpeptidase [Chloroflexales bacterium]|nr:L,D-transpeptidase [Chloroflexales bacterium]
MFLRIPKGWARVGIGCLLLGMLAGIWLAPPSLSADDDGLFFASTGHSVSNTYGFLNHWRAVNGERILGAPVTAAMVENGLTVQYFERGRLEFHPELEGAPILLGRVGVEYAEALWRTFEAAPPRTLAPGEQFFEETSHTLGEPFLSFWTEHGGLSIFGYPISEPLWEYVGARMARVQYFERARLEQYPSVGNEVWIGSLGRDLALLRGLDVGGAAPAAPAPLLPTATPLPPTPAPTAVAPAAPAPVNTASLGGKHIVVDLGDQWLYAYAGETMLFDAPISTGKDGFNTPPGSFTVYSKVRSQTMSGTIGGEYYNVPDVPHVMYINGGVALHGTYWHNQFGTGVRRSHGCINLPLDSAAWLYDWAPLGTPVQVRW